MEKSIFEKEPKKEENKQGKKTRIASPHEAREYYDAAVKISGAEEGDKLSEWTYERLDESLKTIRDNKISQRLNIDWGSLSREELNDIYKNAERLAKENPLLIERIKKVAAPLVALPIVATMMFVIYAQQNPGSAESMDNFFHANGAFIQLCDVFDDGATTNKINAIKTEAELRKSIERVMAWAERDFDFIEKNMDEEYHRDYTPIDADGYLHKPRQIDTAELMLKRVKESREKINAIRQEVDNNGATASHETAIKQIERRMIDDQSSLSVWLESDKDQHKKNEEYDRKRTNNYKGWRE